MYRVVYNTLARQLSPSRHPFLRTMSSRSGSGAQLKTEDCVASQDTQKTTDLDPELIAHLERTSLVDFGSDEAQTRLRSAIEFADTLFEVDTTNVEPMSSVLDDTSLRLRDDVCVKTSRADILANASITEEDYFVSPPGNIPLEKKK